jgi:DNA-binding transcriptional regulator YiaG
MTLRLRRTAKRSSKLKHADRSPAASRGEASGMDVAALRETLGLTRKLFSRLTGYSERAIAKWESAEALGDASRQRMREIQRLQQALAGVMKPEFVGTWLQTSNDAFGGLKPIEVIERGEVDRLWRMIHELESGTPG